MKTFTTNMQTRPIDKLVLGTAQLGLKYGINNSEGKPSIKSSLSLLEAAQRLGIKKLDTSFAYGDAHQVIRASLNEGCSPFSVITKFSLKQFRTPNEAYNQAKLDLAPNQVGSILFHDSNEAWVYNSLPNDLPLGISIYSEEELSRALQLSWVKLIQLPVSLLDFSPEKRKLISLASERKIEIHARSVFLQGLFFMEESKIPSHLAPLNKYLKKIKELAVTYNLTLRELALNYVIGLQGITGLVFGVDNQVQLNENVDALRDHLDRRLINELHDINVKEKKLLNPSNW